MMIVQDKPNWDDEFFKSSPNFLNRPAEKVIEKGAYLSGSSNFEIYQDKKTSQVFIIAGGAKEEEQSIIFYSFPTFEKVHILNGHSDVILCIRHFRNDFNKKDYLITADRKSSIIVWDLETLTQVNSAINAGSSGFVYSCLLIFRNEQIFAVTSTISDKGFKIFNMAGKEVSSIHPENSNGVFYLMHYSVTTKNEEGDKADDYIIQLGKGHVTITKLPLLTGNTDNDKENENNENNAKNSGKILKFPGEESVNFGGLIYKKDDKTILLVTNSFGMLMFFDITDLKSIEKPFHQINTEGQGQYYNAVRWNENYILVTDQVNGSFDVIDIGYEKPLIVSQVNFKGIEYPRFIKKIIHPDYGECIICCSAKFGPIYLWRNKDIDIE